MARVAPPLAVGTPGEATPADQPRQVWRRSRRLWVVALVMALAAALLVWQLDGPDPRPLTQRDVDRTVQERLEAAQEEERAAPPDAATAYQTILPSLVVVTTENAARADEVGTGAGVVVSGEGAILTALHVVDGGGQIRVRFADGTQSIATIEAEEPDDDIAVLSVARLPEVVVPAVLGGGTDVGDDVFAVGHPL